MSYIKINGNDTHYFAKVVPFTTYHGNNGVRVISEAPQTDKGFKLYLDDGTLVGDYSEYIYIYDIPTNKYIQYSVENEVLNNIICTNTISKNHMFDYLNNQISQVSHNLSNLSETVVLKADEERVDGIDEVIENILEDIIPSIIEDTANDDINMEDVE